MSRHGELAGKYFTEGYNCSQSVAAAFAKEMNLDTDTVLKLSVGYGGGFGRMREVCGAFSGMVMVAGALYGETDPGSKSALYEKIQELAGEYKTENGRNSIICRELLGLDKDGNKEEVSPTASERTSEYYSKRPCAQLVEIAADIMERYIEEHPIKQDK